MTTRRWRSAARAAPPLALAMTALAALMALACERVPEPHTVAEPAEGAMLDASNGGPPEAAAHDDTAEPAPDVARRGGQDTRAPAPGPEQPLEEFADAGVNPAREAPVEDRAELDLPYPPPPGAESDHAFADVYYRPDGRPKRLVVLVHGGGWVGGDKENLRVQAPSLIPWWLDCGFVVLAVNFRLATPLGQLRQVGPMDQVRDIAHAMAWFTARSDEWGVSVPGAVLFGFSSGAHLVALLSADGRYLEEAGLSRDFVAASVSVDVHAYDVPFALELMVDSVVAPNIPLIEHLFGPTEREQLEASPITYVGPAPRATMPDTLLLSAQPSPDIPGTHGYIVWHTAQRYRDALSSAGHRAEHHHFEHHSHTSLMTPFGLPHHTPTIAVGIFLHAVLPPPSGP